MDVSVNVLHFTSQKIFKTSKELASKTRWMHVYKCNEGILKIYTADFRGFPKRWLLTA